MSRLAVELDRISKRYVLGERSERYDTLREAMRRRFTRGARAKPAGEGEIWALADLTLAIDAGEVVGVVGANGAGKSTLLRIIARITQPTAGRGRVRGRVGSLLDVGTGFHYELTGRENIYLGGTVLGLSRREIRSRFDEIVDFAQVERFLDTPLKRYSAGMHLRLAFAVAAHLPSEILVVDEVLAVGDAGFQRKCLGAMSDVGRQGRTVIFVSHDLGAIQRMCQRALWLDRGRLQADGAPHDVLDSYAGSFGRGDYQATFADRTGAPVELLSVALADPSGHPIGVARRDQAIDVRIRVGASASLPDLAVGIFLSRRGVRLLDEWLTDSDEDGVGVEAGNDYELSVTIPPVLPAGDYELSVWAASHFETYWEREVLAFRLWPRLEDREHAISRNRLLQPPMHWHVRRLGSPDRSPEALR